MAEMNTAGNYFRKGTEENTLEMTQSPAYPGSWQQALRNNEGQYCIVDFLIGTDTLVQKEGIIYDVGVSFVVLFEPRTGNYIVCDLYAIKFVTFVASGVVPVSRTQKRRV